MLVKVNERNNNKQNYPFHPFTLSHLHPLHLFHPLHFPSLTAFDCDFMMKLMVMIKKLLLFSFFALTLQGLSNCRNAEAQNGNKEQQPTSEINSNTNSGIADTNAKRARKVFLFYDVLNAALKKRGIKIETVCDTNDSVSRRIMEEYGALFLASENVRVPPVCMFTSEQDVQSFQNQASPKSSNVGGITIELQTAAMDALLAARQEAQQAGLNITPRGGDAARRTYYVTLKLWDSRFQPALNYWKSKGKLSAKEVSRLRSLSIKEQVREVLELEKHGIYFSKDFSKSILYSVAAPGTSQHLSMLALDVAQYGNKRVREILARHGWFQTVKSDQPHFTYLGVDEATLPALGLTSVQVGGQVFWIPNIGQ